MSGVQGISSQGIGPDPSIVEDSKLIHEAQTLLVDLGYNVDRSGHYDGATRSALASFQSLEGLRHRDGRFDGDSLIALRGAVHGETNISPGLAAENIRAQTGTSTVSTYDSARRVPYMDRIAANSTQAVHVIDTIGPEGNATMVEFASREVSALRDAERAATQQQLSFGGRVLSEKLETPKTFDERFAEKLASAADEHEAFFEVAESAGKSNQTMKSVSTISRAVGPVAAGIGVGMSIGEVAVAPPAQRGRVASREVGAAVTGAAFATGGVAAGAGLGATAATVLGIAAGPAGWVIIGTAMVGGAALGYLGSKVGGWAGEEVYRAVNR